MSVSKVQLDASQEKILVAQAQAGDKRSMQRLITAYYDRMYHVALKVTKDPNRAQDVVQEACIHVIRKIHQYLGVSPFGAWICRIVVNAALQRRRKEKRLVPCADVYGDDVRCPQANPEVLNGDRQLLAKAGAALEELRDGDREIFTWRFIDGMTLEEISAETGFTVAALKSRVHRARQHLKGAAESWGIELDAAA